jgi:peptide deformylase
MIITNKVKLHMVSKPTTWAEVEELDLINKLKEACSTAWVKGYGLAAIQIGIPIQFAWINVDGKDHYLINTKITEYKGKRKMWREGCLSIPNQWYWSYRHNKIKGINNDKPFAAKGLIAHIVQHEVDHFNGKLVEDNGRLIL